MPSFSSRSIQDKFTINTILQDSQHFEIGLVFSSENLDIVFSKQQAEGFWGEKFFNIKDHFCLSLRPPSYEYVKNVFDLVSLGVDSKTAIKDSEDEGKQLFKLAKFPQFRKSEKVNSLQVESLEQFLYSSSNLISFPFYSIILKKDIKTTIKSLENLGTFLANAKLNDMFNVKNERNLFFENGIVQLELVLNFSNTLKALSTQHILDSFERYFLNKGCSLTQKEIDIHSKQIHISPHNLEKRTFVLKIGPEAYLGKLSKAPKNIIAQSYLDEEGYFALRKSVGSIYCIPKNIPANLVSMGVKSPILRKLRKSYSFFNYALEIFCQGNCVYIVSQTNTNTYLDYLIKSLSTNFFELNNGIPSLWKELNPEKIFSIDKVPHILKTDSDSFTLYLNRSIDLTILPFTPEDILKVLEEDWEEKTNILKEATYGTNNTKLDIKSKVIISKNQKNVAFAIDVKISKNN